MAYIKLKRNDHNQRGFSINLVEFNNESLNEQINKLRIEIGCDYIEVVGLPNDIYAIVDEEGTFIPNSPVYEVYHKDYPELIAQFVGTIIFGKAKMTADGLDIVGLNDEEIDNFLENTSIQLIGYTKPS